VLDHIGETPLVELRNLVDESRGRIFAKLESANPSGSKDDRVAKQLLEDALAAGVLQRCQTVVAAVDGTMAKALAMACAVHRNPLIVVLSRSEPSPGTAALEMLGCEVVWVDSGSAGAPGRVSFEDREQCRQEARRLATMTGAFDADLLCNSSAFRAHRLGTGVEILRQLKGELGGFVDFVRTGATLAGCTATFHEFDPSIRCYAVEPVGAAALSGEPVIVPEHGIDGGGLGLAVLPLLDTTQLAGFVPVSREEAHAATRELARKEGLCADLATGASLVAALRLLDGECFGYTLAVIVRRDALRDGVSLSAESELEREAERAA